MSRTSNGWRVAKRAPEDHPAKEALLIDGCKIKARLNDGDNYLWLNVQVEGGWTYILVERDTREIVLQTVGRTKRECWEAAAEQLA